MTKEEILTLDMSGIEERISEIEAETPEADSEALDNLTAELDAIEERKAQIKTEAEEKRAAIEAVIETAEIIEEPNKEEEKRTMTNTEIRGSVEYENAWVEYIKGNKKADEVRVLLSDNVEDGVIPVPTYVEERIETAWENDGVMSRVRKAFFKGNLAVATEISASGAGFHLEGSDETVPEEKLEIVKQILQPITLKKWITISDEVWNDYTGRRFSEYVLDEIEYQLVKLAASMMVGAINNAAAVNIPHGEVAVSAPAITDIVTAAGYLTGDASDIVFVANNATIAAYRALALTANYGVDPFAGATVIAADWIPSFDNASLNSAFAYLGDLKSFIYNFPNGDQPTFKIDDLSLAEKDLVKIVGRMPVAAGYTKPNGITVFLKDDESE